MPVTKHDKDIILKAAELSFGDSLFIPCKTKKEQQKQFTVYHNLGKSYCSNIEPDIKLIVGKTFQDKRLWIKITKEEATADLFIKKESGEVVHASNKPIDLEDIK